MLPGSGFLVGRSQYGGKWGMSFHHSSEGFLYVWAPSA